MSKRNTYDVDTVPAAPPPRSERSYYPWDKMPLGGTFFIPADKEVSVNSCRQNVYAANRRYAAKGLSNRYRCWPEKSDDSPSVLLGMRVQRCD